MINGRLHGLSIDERMDVLIYKRGIDNHLSINLPYT